MKNNITVLLCVLLFLGSVSVLAQSSKYGTLAQDSWSLGFGGTFPRFVSAEVEATNTNYGGFLSIQRNFSEHVGLRLRGSYNHMEGEYITNNTVQTLQHNAVAGDLDIIYYLAPCEPVSPFLVIGAGVYTFENTNGLDPTLINKRFNTYQFNIGFGAEWRLSQWWSLKTELGYHTVSGSKIDAIYDRGNGLIGGSNDTYMNMDLGFIYYFSKGEKSNICDLYDGLQARVDYDKIEEIVKRYAVDPTEVDYNRIEDMIKKHKAVSELPDKWVLIGVNFDFNKSTLRPESFPILTNAAQILLKNPEVKVEIQGHTDNIGSEAYNKKLSLERAETVKRFLVAKGVSADRLTTAGFGFSQPVADNKTAQGRELNRRIEFKVIK